MVRILIYHKDGQWHLCNERVKYIQNEEEILQPVGSEGHEWWINFGKLWKHTEIVEFVPIVPTKNQMVRFEEILQLNLVDGFGGEMSEYVENGIFPSGFSHALRPLQILKQQVEQDEYLIDLDFRQTLSEMEVEIDDIYGL